MDLIDIIVIALQLLTFVVFALAVLFIKRGMIAKKRHQTTTKPQADIDSAHQAYPP